MLDDNPADGNLVRRTLKKVFGEDLDIRCCEESETALAMVKSERISCAFVDYLLGSESGLDVVESLKSTSPNLPVIVLTGEGNEAVAVKAMKLGAFDYLVKSEINAKSLRSAVISAMKRSELQSRLKSKQEELESFAYSAAHDIRSPVSTIHQLSSLISQKLSGAEFEGSDKVASWAGSINELSGEIIELVGDLLEYARSGRVPSFSAVSLKELFKDIEARLAHLLSEKNAVIELPTEDLVLQGDYTSLLQLFQNLVSNGLKFHSPDATNPKVTVSWRRVCEVDGEPKIEVTVEDNGIGIARENLDRIFFPLVRLTKKDSSSGAGLGLAIAKRVIEQHEGKIDVDSVLGEGTEFTVLFPELNLEQNSEKTPSVSPQQSETTH